MRKMVTFGNIDVTLSLKEQKSLYPKVKKLLSLVTLFFAAILFDYIHFQRISNASFHSRMFLYWRITP